MGLSVQSWHHSGFVRNKQETYTKALFRSAYSIIIMNSVRISYEIGTNIERQLVLPRGTTQWSYRTRWHWACSRRSVDLSWSMLSKLWALVSRACHMKFAEWNKTGPLSYKGNYGPQPSGTCGASYGRENISTSYHGIECSHCVPETQRNVCTRSGKCRNDIQRSYHGLRCFLSTLRTSNLKISA